MNNRKRLTEKIRMLLSIRNLQLNEIIGMQKTASALGEKRAYAKELDVRKKLVIKTKRYYGEDV